MTPLLLLAISSSIATLEVHPTVSLTTLVLPLLLNFDIKGSSTVVEKVEDPWSAGALPLDKVVLEMSRHLKNFLSSV